MKKLLALALAMALIMLTLPTAVLASPEPAPFDFSKLLTEEGEACASMYLSPNVTGTLKQGFWVAAIDGSSLDGILTTTALNGLPVFLLNSPTARTFIWPAAQASEKDKMLKTLSYIDGDWYTGASHIRFASEPIRRTSSSEIIGYTAYLYSAIVKGLNGNAIYYYVNSNNMVYAMILSMSDSSRDPTPAWDLENWPKDNEALTKILREQLNTKENYTFFIAPDFGEKKKGHTNLLYLPITATASEGGSITEPGEKIFRPGDISQKYTVIADDGYTIYYIQVDGKTVPNSINCGDTAAFTFEAIYGPRSIHAVFKKK